MKPKRFITSSQEHATDPYPESHKSSSHLIP